MWTNVDVLLDSVPTVTDNNGADAAWWCKRRMASSVKTEKKQLSHERNVQADDFHGAQVDGDDQCAHDVSVVSAEERSP